VPYTDTRSKERSALEPQDLNLYCTKDLPKIKLLHVLECLQWKKIVSSTLVLTNTSCRMCTYYQALDHYKQRIGTSKNRGWSAVQESPRVNSMENMYKMSTFQRGGRAWTVMNRQKEENSNKFLFTISQLLRPTPATRSCGALRRSKFYGENVPDVYISRSRVLRP